MRQRLEELREEGQRLEQQRLREEIERSGALPESER